MGRIGQTTRSTQAGQDRTWLTVHQDPRERPFVSALAICRKRLPNLVGMHAAASSGPDLRFFNSLRMNIGSAFNLSVVIRLCDHIRHIIGQESAGLALP